MLVLGRLLQPDLKMVVDKAKNLPWLEAPERGFTRVVYKFTRKHKTRPETIARSKHSSLFRPLMSYEENKVLSIQHQVFYSQNFIFFVT